MTPRRWMALVWAAIPAGVVGVCATQGGRHCQVPAGGPFHRLLAGHEYAVARAGKVACIQVK